jgi:hypothetical protein
MVKEIVDDHYRITLDKVEKGKIWQGSEKGLN